MRILYVQDTDWVRRNPFQHTHLAERLALRGHEVRVIDYEILWRAEGKKELLSHRQVFTMARLVEGGEVTVIRPPILKVPVLDYASMLITYTREINRQTREFRPDVIIGDAILTTMLGYRAAHKHGIPTVYYILDVNPRLIPFRFLRWLGRLMERRNIRQADRVLAINQGLRDYTIRQGAHPDRAMVITAGMDPARSDPAISGAEIRERYGIAGDDVVLLFVGWIHHFNGLKEIALALAEEPDPRFKLLVVGDGDGYAELERLREGHHLGDRRLKDHGLKDRLILTGRRPYDEVPSLIAAADCCLLPAYADEPAMQHIVPIKMYDYMAMGKPVIVTRLPGIVKEFGEDSGLVYVDRPEQAVNAALEMVRAGTAGELGAKARSFIEQYDWDSIADRFERTLAELAGEGQQDERLSQRVQGQGSSDNGRRRVHRLEPRPDAVRRGG